MINEQVMADTVSRLLEAGIDDPTIISTLTDAGLSNEEAAGILQKVKAAAASPPASQEPAVGPQDIRLIKTQLETQAEQHDLHQTATINTLDDHEEKIANIASQVEEVKAAVSSAGPLGATMDYRVSELENKLEEVNAQVKAALEVLKDILDTNRKILTDLEAEK